MTRDVVDWSKTRMTNRFFRDFFWECWETGIKWALGWRIGHFSPRMVRFTFGCACGARLKALGVGWTIDTARNEVWQDHLETCPLERDEQGHVIKT